MLARRRRRVRRSSSARKAHHGLGARAKKSSCHPSGIKSNGRLRKGFRWAKGRKGCAVRARKSK